MNTFYLKNVKIVKNDAVHLGCVEVENGKIKNIFDDSFCCEKGIDCKGNYLFPGFIDLHCHGGIGFDFMDASPKEMKEIADFHLLHGTTTMLATTLSGSKDETENSLKNFSEYLKNNPNGSLVGVHLEGPYFNPLQCGAQDTRYMRNPNSKEFVDLKQRFPFIRRISVAPELDGGIEFGGLGRKLGVLMSIAHTDADFNTVCSAFDSGYNLLTHFYSGMKGVTRVNSYRIAGAVEAGYYLEDLYVEIIADGKHLPIELLKLIYKIKGPDRICLITDAVRPCGFPNGTTSIIGSKTKGNTILIEDDVAKMPDRQSFAGSVATFDRLIKTMANAIGKDVVALAKMASTTPAKIAGLVDRGEIKVGKIADFVLMDEELNLIKTIKGEI